MLRTARYAPRGLVYHALSRAVARLALFEKQGGDQAFARVMDETQEKHPTRILAWCLIPNRWQQEESRGEVQRLTLFPFLLAAQQAQDPPPWILISWFLLFVFAGTAVVYLSKVVDAWIHDHANTSRYATVFGALWVFLCACVMGMDYFSYFLPKGPLTKLAEKTPRLHGSPWVYGIAIGSVVVLLIIMGAVNLYQKYAGHKKTRTATYHLTRKDEEHRERTSFPPSKSETNPKSQDPRLSHENRVPSGGACPLFQANS